MLLLRCATAQVCYINSMESIEAWQEDVKKKKDDLSLVFQRLGRKQRRSDQSATTLITIQEALDVQDFDVFEASVDRLCSHYENNGATKLFNRYLYPHFGHIKSFSQAIGQMTQDQDATSLCWGSILTVIQVSHLADMAGRLLIIDYLVRLPDHGKRGRDPWTAHQPTTAPARLPKGHRSLPRELKAQVHTR